MRKERKDNSNSSNNTIVEHQQKCQHGPAILNDPERLGECNPAKRHTPRELSLKLLHRFSVNQKETKNKRKTAKNPVRKLNQLKLKPTKNMSKHLTIKPRI